MGERKKKKKKKDKEIDIYLESDDDHKNKKKKKHKHKHKSEEYHTVDIDKDSDLVTTNEIEAPKSLIQNDKPQLETSPLEIKRGDASDNNNDTTELGIETIL